MCILFLPVAFHSRILKIVLASFYINLFKKILRFHFFFYMFDLEIINNILSFVIKI